MAKPSAKSKSTKHSNLLATLAVLILGVVIVAFIVRIINLTTWPIFADEAIYVRWAQIMHAEPSLRFLPLSDGKQPLYMWILMFVVHKFSDPLFAGRALSVVAGAATVGVATSFSFYLFKSRLAALATGVMLAVIPFSVFYDRMALVDSVLTLFGVLFAVFGVWMAKTQRLDAALLSGFFLGLALLTKSTGIFLIVLYPLSIVFANLTKRTILTKGLKFVLLCFVSLLVAFGMYNILRLGPNFHLIGSRNADYVFGLTHIFTSPLDPLIPHLNDVKTWYMILGGVGLFALVIVSVLNGLKQRRVEVVYLASFISVVVIGQSEYAKVFTARYILLTVPFVVILATAIFSFSKVRFAQRLSVLLFVIFIIGTLGFFRFVYTDPPLTPIPQNERSGYLEEWSSGIGIAESAKYIKAAKALNTDKTIVVATEGYFGTLPDGLQIYLEGETNIIVKGVGIDLKEIPTSMIEAKAVGDIVFLAINSTRLKLDPAKFGLRLVAAYPKPFRTPQSREYNLFGPQESFFLFEFQGLPDNVKSGAQAS